IRPERLELREARGERRGFGIEIHEQETVPELEADALQPLLVAELLEVGRPRCPDQAPVQVVGPEVQRATQTTGSRARLAGDDLAAVLANRAHRVDRTLAVPHNEERLTGHIGCEIVARPGDLLIVPNARP